MLFNSIDFAIFLPVVFILYWYVTNSNLKIQNLLIVVASYVFYGWWDWRFLFLIFLSTMIDYAVGLKLRNETRSTKRKFFLWISIIFNLGFLAIFKYYNFFQENFIKAFSFFGAEINSSSLNIILPVGISFYTFQTLSYSIDVYKNKITPTKDFIAFSAFVSFFPQLVAGPIERASNLLPQFFTKRTLDYDSAVQGVSQILWGLFKKIVIADNCAFIVNQIFNQHESYSGSTLALGSFLFAFQIYCDFSGYSDIAIGTATLFGFKLKQNFSYPYFSRNFGEFWKRWHISLNTWFRDYVYIPLGGSRATSLIVIRNIFIVFALSGLWHGANWTFIIWGLLNAIFFIPLILNRKRKANVNLDEDFTLFPSLKEFFQMGITFTFTVFAWIFFRADDVSMAISIIKEIFSSSIFMKPYVFGVGKEKAVLTITFIFILIIIEWFGRRKEIPIYTKENKIFLHWLICYMLVISIFLFGGKPQEFIYFQF